MRYFVLFFIGSKLLLQAQTPMNFVMSNSYNVNYGSTFIGPMFSYVTVAGSITSDAKYDVEASQEILFTPNSNISGFNPGGYFYGRIQANDFILYDMFGNWNVDKWKKIEIGISLPTLYDQKIEDFLNGQNTATSINPYDPDQFKVKATFHRPDGTSVERFGFYYRDFSTTSSTYQEAKSNQPFRVRFAPDIEGSWGVTFEYYLNNSKVGETSGFFNCIYSNLRGPLSVGTYNHFKTAVGDVFTVIGQDFGPLNHPVPNNYGLPIQHADVTNYIGHINNLADNGGNFIRIPMDYDNFYLEWEETGVYGSNRMSNENFMRQFKAYELDRVFQTLEDRQMYCFLLTETDQLYQINNAYGTGPSSWPNHPYASLSNITIPVDVFSNSSVLDIYKKRLFYIQARYGYSPNLAAYEVCNEIDGINRGTSDSYANSSLTRQIVYDWAVNVADYYKSFYPVHMTTISNVDDVFQNPAINPTSNTSFDIRSPHHYGYDRDVPYTRYEHTQTQLFGVGGLPGPLASVVRKPVLYGEMGMTDDTNGDKCTEVEFHNGMWVSGCSGGAGAGLYRYDYENDTKRNKHIPALAAFFANMPFEESDFYPGYYHANPVQEEVFYNVNFNGSKAFGWVHNWYYYWASDIDLVPNCINNDHGESQTPNTHSFYEEIDLKGFRGLRDYEIELWNCYGSGGVIYQQAQQSTLFGHIKFQVSISKYPGDDGGNPDMGLKIFQQGLGFRTTNNSENPNYNSDKGEIYGQNDTLFLANTTETISAKFDSTISYHHWDFGNGESSDDQNPIINFHHDGNYPVVYSAINSLGDTVHYHQNTVVYTNTFEGQKKVEHLIANDISLLPNPSQNIFKILTSGYIKVESYSVYDNKGALILKSSNFDSTFDLSNFRTGLYFVVFNTDHGIIIKKAIKID
jgi:hypothetical protein